MPLILKNRVSAHASTNPSNMSPMARTTRVRTCATIALYQDMQLTTPIEPAMAVSTAINTLRTLPQSTFLDIDYEKVLV